MWNDKSYFNDEFCWELFWSPERWIFSFCKLQVRFSGHVFPDFPSMRNDVPSSQTPVALWCFPFFKHIVLKMLFYQALVWWESERSVFPPLNWELCRLLSILHRWPLTFRWRWRRQLFIVKLTIYYKPNEPDEHELTSAATPKSLTDR